MILKRLKFRIYPTERQKLLMNKHFGCSRWIYNWALQRKIEHYEKHGKAITIFDIQREMVKMKKEESMKWLSEVSAQSLQEALRNLDKAFTRFFKKQNKFPCFKKKGNYLSFGNCQGNSIDERVSLLRIYKFSEGIKIRLSRPIIGTIKSVTISRSPSGKYHASILVSINEELPRPDVPSEKSSLGLDFGLSDLVVSSDGERFNNPRVLKRYLSNLNRLQKSFSRKVKGSKNREKLRLRIARLHERISNIRNDNLHKISHHLVCKNQAATLCIEDLSVGDMASHKQGTKALRRSIGDAGWRELRRQLEYKCRWYGKNLRVIGRFDPSSKICSECGSINRDLRLADRDWTCQCGVHHDRDINAAINIKKMAFRQQNTSFKAISRLTVERIPRDARKSKPVEPPVWVSLKQESMENVNS